MEIQNEIIKTKGRVDLLERQNGKFKTLLEKALVVTKKCSSKSTACESLFLQESIEIIERETENLKYDLNCLSIEEDSSGRRSRTGTVDSVEGLLQIQQKEIDSLKAEHAEIKFLLLHPESRNTEWLKNILELENDVSQTNVSLVEERFRLQRKILNLEKKKAELLLAINDAAIPINIGSSLHQGLSETSNDEDELSQYEDLRFRMLNLEDERSRLLNDLQCVLNRSRKEIAEEYNNLQAKILQVEQEKASLNIVPIEPCQKFSNRELDSIFGAFRNLPLKELEERMRIERMKTSVGTMFCPGVNLPVYCNIL